MGRHPHLITHTFALQRVNVPAEFDSAKDILECLSGATVHELAAHVDVLGHRIDALPVTVGRRARRYGRPENGRDSHSIVRPVPKDDRGVPFPSPAPCANRVAVLEDWTQSPKFVSAHNHQNQHSCHYRLPLTMVASALVTVSPPAFGLMLSAATASTSSVLHPARSSAAMSAPSFLIPQRGIVQSRNPGGRTNGIGRA